MHTRKLGRNDNCLPLEETLILRPDTLIRPLSLVEAIRNIENASRPPTSLGFAVESLDIIVPFIAYRGEVTVGVLPSPAFRFNGG